MQYISLVILGFYLFIYLFFVFIFAKDSFVLLRRNITTDRVFNISFVVALVGLLSARIFFVAFHFKPVYFNPLVFFLFPYFPGLSAAGGIAGAILFIIFFCRQNKLPVLHLIDIFALAALPVIPLGMFISLWPSRLIYFAIPFVVVDIIFFWLLVAGFLRVKFADGVVGYWALIIASILLYSSHAIRKTWFAPDDLLLIGLFAVSIYFLFRQEGSKSFGLSLPLPKIKIKKPKKERWRVLR